MREIEVNRKFWISFPISFDQRSYECAGFLSC